MMINESLNKYLTSLLPERHSFFYELEEYALEHRIPIMDSVAIETMLQILTIQSPKKILEIGTAIGYSALRMADALPQANIVTIEMDQSRISEAKSNILHSKMENRITLLEGNALDLYDDVKNMGPYDAIFIDAAKAQYIKFFELYQDLLTDSGCIYTDNVLFKGLVAQENTEIKRLAGIAKKIRSYNQYLAELQKFHTVIIPTGDGLAISRKNE